jgi:hypothetical protein
VRDGSRGDFHIRRSCNTDGIAMTIGDAAYASASAMRAAMADMWRVEEEEE